jgi:hypothetical protein
MFFAQNPFYNVRSYSFLTSDEFSSSNESSELELVGFFTTHDAVAKKNQLFTVNGEKKGVSKTFNVYLILQLYYVTSSLLICVGK